MSETGHRYCKCGAVYRRTENMANVREIASFEGQIGGETLETWNTAWVPTYWLIAGPVSQTE
jgi:stage III sporulation protein SpoIIIAA